MPEPAADTPAAEPSEQAHFDASLAAALAEGGPDEPEPEPGEKAPEGDEPIQVSPDLADPPEEEEKTEPDAAAKAKDEPKKDEPKPEDDGKKLRDGFSALSRERKKLREREAAAAAKEQQAAVHVQKAQAFDQVLARLRTDPASVIRELGGDELTNKLLDGIVASEKSPAEREVEKLKADLQRRDDEAKAAQQQAQIQTWRDGVKSTVIAAGERFDLVNSLDQHDAVIETITAYYQKYNGAVLPVEDAAQVVEDVLAKGLAKSKKFGARVPVTNAQPATNGKTAPVGRKPGSTTLSSVSSSELPPSGEDLPLDPEERFRRVMAGLDA